MLASDFGFILADLPQTLTYEGNSYSGVITALTTNNELMMEGYKPRLELQIYVKQSDMTPVVGKRITYSAVQYRIDTAEKSSDGITWRLQCKELMA